MERGRLDVDERQAYVFVFEGLLSHLEHPLLERLALRSGQSAAALRAWSPDFRVWDYISNLARRSVPVEVITWHSVEFADLVADQLAYNNIPVRSVRSEVYERVSATYAVDPYVVAVFDPDPHHRWGYGFKAREFSLNG